MSKALDENVLIRTYVQLVTNELYNAMLAEIQPKLRQAAKDAVAGMETYIEAHALEYAREYLIKLDVHFKESKP